MLSLHTGYDTGYLTDAVGTGADYYLGAEGEPPGYWQGAGAPGSRPRLAQVDADVMRRLYHEDIGPDGQVLGRRQRKANYPEAGGSLYKRVEDEVARVRAERGRFFTPEEERALRLKLRSAYRTVVPFYDYTYSRAQERLGALGFAPGRFGRSGGRGPRSGRRAVRRAGRAGPRSGEAGQ